MEHTHDFDEADWPFDEPIDRLVFSTVNVFEDGFPLLTIAHDHDGDWQFLCGMTDDPGDMFVVCFGCMFELQPMIAQFSDLPKGWLAWRDSENDPWQTEPLEEEE